MMKKIEVKKMTGRMLNEQKILSSLKDISEKKGLTICKDIRNSRLYIGGHYFKLYFLIDSLSDNSIIWSNLEFPLIADFHDIDKQFSISTKRLIYDLMKEVEDIGIKVEPF